jgi:hypothetical protein
MALISVRRRVADHHACTRWDLGPLDLGWAAHRRIESRRNVARADPDHWTQVAEAPVVLVGLGQRLVVEEVDLVARNHAAPPCDPSPMAEAARRTPTWTWRFGGILKLIS